MSYYVTPIPFQIFYSKTVCYRHIGDIPIIVVSDDLRYTRTQDWVIFAQTGELADWLSVES